MKNGSLPNFLSLRVQLIALTLLCILLYANTLQNKFALDDIVVLSQNKYVKKGPSGIHNLLTKDSFYGHYGQAAHLAGGRWRPLSLVLLAIEYPFFGLTPSVYHVNNVLFYTLCCLAFFALLRKYLLKDNSFAAFGAAILFAIHPIHTEVVANIKSLDELMSLLLLLTTLYYSLNYINEGRNAKDLLIALAAYFFALLAKENGITFFALLPLTFYCFTKDNYKNALLNSLPYIGVGLAYLFMRLQIVTGSEPSTELLNAPYLYATADEKIATKLYVLGKYLYMLFVPYPLSYDYSYSQIPYVTFKNVWVIASALVYLALAAASVIALRTKSVLAYGALFYLCSISIVSNFVADIGTTMGERFLFQPSIGFTICMGLLLSYCATAPVVRNIVLATILVVTAVYAYAVVNRNADWRSDETLFLHDAKVATASVKANYFAGIALINSADKETDTVAKTKQLKEALYYFKKAMQIDTTIPEIFLNEGVAYSRLNDIENAEKSWDRVRALSPNSKDLKQDEAYLHSVYSKMAREQSEKKNYEKAIYYARKGIRYDSLDVNLWFNLGGQYFILHDYQNARLAWQKTLSVDSTFALAIQGIKDLNAIEGRK